MGIDILIRWVMVIYGFSICLCFLYLGYRAIYFSEDVFESIAEIIQVAVIPVVTFVVGYFLGSEPRGRN